MKALIISQFNQNEFEKLAGLISNSNSWVAEEPVMVYICGGANTHIEYVDSFEHLMLRNSGLLHIYVDSHVIGTAKAFASKLYKYKNRFSRFESVQQKPLESILF